VGVRVRGWKGAWWVFINYRGQRKARRIGEGAAGKKAAEQVAVKIQARLVDGDRSPLEPPAEPAPVFQDYARRWVAETIAPHRKPRTEEFYRRVLELHALPAFGLLPLDQITRAGVRAFIAAKAAAKLSRFTVRNLVATLRAVLNQAVEDGLLASNPATKFGRYLHHREDPRAHVTALTAAEVARVLAAVERWYPEYDELVALLFLTGVREGEAFGLQWGDLDVVGGFLEVRRTVDFRPGRFLVGTPKSGRTRRVDVPVPLMKRLTALQSVREAEAVVQGRAPSSWLFPALTNPAKPMNASWFRKHVWYPLLPKAGIRRIRIHDARHTYATLLLQAGEPIVYVKEQLGHSSIQVTVDLYGHLIPGANRAAVDRLARAIDEARPHPDATSAQPQDRRQRGHGAEVRDVS